MQRQVLYSPSVTRSPTTTAVICIGRLPREITPCASPPRLICTRTANTHHYRYNLKRKVAGLPPVTREWFEEKKAQLTLASSHASSSQTKVWIDTLSKKKFYSENTYLAYTRSKKYTDMVNKKRGGVAPEPLIKLYSRDVAASSTADTSKTDGSFGMKKLNQGRMVYGEDDGEGGESDGSAWETASDEEEGEDDGEGGEGGDGGDPSTWEKWDVCQSLFDNHVSGSMEDNLEYMWKTYGFYLPDSKYLRDPEGLLQYLGAKMRYGHLPLYESGLNPEARRLKSLHGVQRHMVDRGKCKILYENNEDEYEDYYDYSMGDEEATEESMRTEEFRQAMVALNGENTPGWFQAAAGYELAIPNRNGGGVKILGTREFARYYKQRHFTPRPKASRDAAVAAAGGASAAMVAVNTRYKQLTVPVFGDGTVEGHQKAEQKRVMKCKERVERLRLMASMRRNVNDNLPRNVPY